MRIGLHVLAIVMLGCWSLWAQSTEPASQSPAQQPGTPSSKTPDGSSAADSACSRTQPTLISKETRISSNKLLRVWRSACVRGSTVYQCQVDGTFRKAEQVRCGREQGSILQRASPKVLQLPNRKDQIRRRFRFSHSDRRSQCRSSFPGTSRSRPDAVQRKLELGKRRLVLVCADIQTRRNPAYALWGRTDPLPQGSQTRAARRRDRDSVSGSRTRLELWPASKRTRSCLSQLPFSNQTAIIEDQIYFANTTKVSIKFHIDKDLPAGITVEPMSGELKAGEGIAHSRFLTSRREVELRRRCSTLPTSGMGTKT